MIKASRTREDILTFIQEFKAGKDYSPTVREIAEHCARAQVQPVDIAARIRLVATAGGHLHRSAGRLPESRRARFGQGRFSVARRHDQGRRLRAPDQALRAVGSAEGRGRRLRSARQRFLYSPGLRGGDRKRARDLRPEGKDADGLRHVDRLAPVSPCESSGCVSGLDGHGNVTDAPAAIPIHTPLNLTPPPCASVYLDACHPRAKQRSHRLSMRYCSLKTGPSFASSPHA